MTLYERIVAELYTHSSRCLDNDAEIHVVAEALTLALGSTPPPRNCEWCEQAALYGETTCKEHT